MDDELSEGDIELIVFERQIVSRRGPGVDTGVTLADRADEWLGGVDGGHRLGSEPADQLLGEGTGATTDVESPLPGLHPGQVCQLRAE